MTYIADIKSYLFYKLFGTFKIDVSIASSTGLFNIHKQIWDPEALSLIDITHNQLPQVVDATAQANGFTSFALKRLKIDPAITFVYGAFDGALSNLGVGALDNKSIAITIGTSAAVRIMTTKPLLEPQLFCYALDTKHWIVGGPLNNGGNIFQWAVEQLLDVNKDIDDTYAYANQLIAKVPIGAHGLIFHPFLNGARAPLWDANARGSFIGLNGLHTRSDMLRAVMEGINMNIYSVFKTVCELSGTPKRVIATGGFAKSEIWKQILADILNIPVLVPIAYESGTLGAAVIAMKSLGLIDDLSRVKDFVGPMKTYQPNAHNAAIYKKYLSTFEKIEKQLKPIYQDISNLQK